MSPSSTQPKGAPQTTLTVIPGKRGRKRRIRHDKRRYRERWRIEATFNRLKDFRRIATRYDKLARNYASTLALVAVIVFWCLSSLDPSDPDTKSHQITFY